MILIVDDDPDIVKLLRKALEDEGYEVAIAHDGVEAYAEVCRAGCRGMVLDVTMPRINGIELLLLMQADGIEVPTVVMVGFDDFAEQELKQFSNVIAFLRKPFDLATLIAIVKRQM